jgi:hypothetical protein
MLGARAQQPTMQQPPAMTGPEVEGRVRDVRGDQRGRWTIPAPAIAQPRLVLKNSLSRLPHSAARTPAVTSTR